MFCQQRGKTKPVLNAAVTVRLSSSMNADCARQREQVGGVGRREEPEEMRWGEREEVRVRARGERGRNAIAYNVCLQHSHNSANEREASVGEGGKGGGSVGREREAGRGGEREDPRGSYGAKKNLT